MTFSVWKIKNNLLLVKWKFTWKFAGNMNNFGLNCNVIEYTAKKLDLIQVLIWLSYTLRSSWWEENRINTKKERDKWKWLYCLHCPCSLNSLLAPAMPVQDSVYVFHRPLLIRAEPHGWVLPLAWAPATRAHQQKSILTPYSTEVQVWDWLQISYSFYLGMSQ